jgi:hypothetical protein
MFMPQFIQLILRLIDTVHLLLMPETEGIVKWCMEQGRRWYGLEAAGVPHEHR